jgi:hypothetical protein
MQTSNYSAESGRNAGAVVSVVTRAGTNEFHGAAWEFHRSSALNARNFFEQAKPKQHQNQFGISAGGPIARNKLFIFGAYEGVRDRPAASTTSSRPPTPAEAAGDFSYLSKQLKNPFDGTPIPGNKIPASLIDPAAKSLLQYLPPPGSDGRYYGVAPNPRDASIVMVRTDWTENSKQSVFGHYYFNRKEDLTGKQVPGCVVNRHEHAGRSAVFCTDALRFHPHQGTGVLRNQEASHLGDLRNAQPDLTLLHFKRPC